MRFFLSLVLCLVAASALAQELSAAKLGTPDARPNDNAALIRAALDGPPDVLVSPATRAARTQAREALRMTLSAQATAADNLAICDRHADVAAIYQALPADAGAAERGALADMLLTTGNAPEGMRTEILLDITAAPRGDITAPAFDAVLASTILQLAERHADAAHILPRLMQGSLTWPYGRQSLEAAGEAMSSLLGDLPKDTAQDQVRAFVAWREKVAARFADTPDKADLAALIARYDQIACLYPPEGGWLAAHGWSYPLSGGGTVHCGAL
ncbi:MAG: hypothetical protein H6865_00280 [Rhodospirillales bacterium]|nr:hypothetical protein [Alphaproteobacteria bacterium]MCB9986062.1 hypothetical protein [Rhodospirillales bacterium]USO07369.1 MAG: hypothetical protein H6866_08095 [Rhodospirillales bacterium]